MKICLKSCLFAFALLFSFTTVTAQTGKCQPSDCKKSTKCCSSLSASIAALFDFGNAETTASAEASVPCCATTLASNPNCTPEECAKICAGNPDCDPEECAKFCATYQNATPEGRAQLVSTTVATAANYGSEVETPAKKKSCNPAKCAKSCKKGKMGANKKTQTSSL